MTLTTHLPHPCLVADVGGSNARFALAAAPHKPLSAMLKLPTGRHADFADTVREALAAGDLPKPKSFLLAAAGPINGRSLTLTNAETSEGRLTLDGPRLAEALDLEQGLLFNDFEALSLSLPFLGPGDLASVGGGSLIAGAPMLVVGPGTGLGVGALVPADGRFLPVASEGGHVSMGPVTAEDFALWPHLGPDPLSAEDLISGRGLLRLYRGHTALNHVPTAHGTPEAVTAAASSGADSLAVAAGLTMLRLLGRLSGDMALAFGATGGVFIGGGMTPRLRKLLPESGFRAAFEEKGPQAGLMQGIGCALITQDAAALMGLAALAAAPDRFMIDLEPRCWRTP